MCRKHLEHFSQVKFPSCGGMARLSWRTSLGAQIQLGSSFSLLCKDIGHRRHVPPFSISDGNGRMQELACLQLGRGVLGSYSGFLPFLLPTARPQSCCSFLHTIHGKDES